ncbi:ATP-binding cassette domain-containing protein [Rhizosphaericola mali]|uniref:ATP-binding cassette domain-containing protein n=1 Tax=Rhizosphaericola mali TaxID=2545455 RepID=A0A5P2G056_9BACT|nr:ATP-binding cassette domain-containing protein [Rhizosphaericola mali]QES89176.1 ATP-binding cassette domain-containing protein [Rhizosphaericola mali]
MSNPFIVAHIKNIVLNGVSVLENIDFSLNKGENLIITGASGNGKTTMALALAKKLYVNGVIDIFFDKENTEVQPTTKFIEQRYSLKNKGNLTTGFYYQQRFNSSDSTDSYTVMDELLAIDDNKESVENLLNNLNLFERKEAPIIQLSSGEHKRFQLIKALLKPSQLMILDEPFIGLDKASREKLYAIIDERTIKGSTFIIISGVHHAFPKSAAKILELNSNTTHQFSSIKDFTPTLQESKFKIDTDAIPLIQKDSLVFENAIRMVNVNVQYGEKKILNNINWTVKKGEKWLVKGHNGAGKSTLLSLITGDNPQAYANEIYLFDKRRGRGETIWDIKRPIGFVSPEVFAYYDKNLTVYTTVACGLFDTMGLFKKLKPEEEASVAAWLNVFNLNTIQNKRLNTLSSGQQRMVLLANALVKNPPLLLLDEPCQGLDESQTQEFVQMIDILVEKLNTTILYISHYDNEIPNCIDQILQLEHGNPTLLKNHKREILVHE